MIPSHVGLALLFAVTMSEPAKFELVEHECQCLHKLSGITQKDFRVQFGEDATSVSWSLMIFDRGKILPDKGAEISIGAENGMTSSQMGISVLSLDDLPAGDQPRYGRWTLTLDSTLNSIATNHYVEQDIFDCRNMISGSFSANPVVEKNEVTPVYWFASVKGKNGAIKKSDSIHSLLKNYPESSIAVLSIQWE